MKSSHLVFIALITTLIISCRKKEETTLMVAGENTGMIVTEINHTFNPNYKNGHPIDARAYDLDNDKLNDISFIVEQIPDSNGGPISYRISASLLHNQDVKNRVIIVPELEDKKESFVKTEIITTYSGGNIFKDKRTTVSNNFFDGASPIKKTQRPLLLSKGEKVHQFPTIQNTKQQLILHLDPYFKAEPYFFDTLNTYERNSVLCLENCRVQATFSETLYLPFKIFYHDPLITDRYGWIELYLTDLKELTIVRFAITI